MELLREGPAVTSPNGTQAIDRAALLLTQVVHGAEPASFTDLATASGLAKSTTSRLLMALERHQLVRRDHDGRFLPGELFVRYAWQGKADADLVAVAQPFLDELGSRTGETVNLGVVSGVILSGGTARAGGGGAGSDRQSAGPGERPGTPRDAGPMVQQIAQVDSRYMIGGTNWVGLAVPLHCSALGKVLLAFGAAPVPAEPYEARTDRTITTRRELETELATVRDRGFAVTDQELEPGLVAVAAPVFAGSPVAIAALSVSAPASRFTARDIPAAATTCVEVAGALSATMSGRTPYSATTH
jgi:IclR family transcriptional regulator, acetate operon repressor